MRDDNPPEWENCCVRTGCCVVANYHLSRDRGAAHDVDSTADPTFVVDCCVCVDDGMLTYS